MENKITILIVDDHYMLREGLASVLSATPEFELLGCAANGEEAVQMCWELEPNVVLMDLLMPETDGIMAIRKIHEAQPAVHIIALTSFAEPKLVHSAMAAGATGYLMKNISADSLTESIRIANKGIATFSPEIAPVLLQNSSEDVMSDLTSREQDVLGLMLEGFSNAEIAFRLSISKNTVKNHVSNILYKLKVRSRTEAVRLALQHRYNL